MRKEPKKPPKFQPLHPALWEVTSMLMNKVADKADNLFNHYLDKQLGINSKLFGVLFLLNSDGPSSQIDLAQLLGADKASMVHYLDHLEKLELAKRTLNPRDRRYHVITITEKGLEVLQIAVQIYQTVESELFSALNEEERRLLNGLLRRVLQ